MRAVTCNEREIVPETIRLALLEDYVASGARGNPKALHGRLPKRQVLVGRARALAQRQERHQAARQSVD